MSTGIATGRAHSNLALIKYWGNRDEALRLPANGSISVVLGGLFTTTTVAFRPELTADEVTIDDQRAIGGAAARVTGHLDHLRQLAGVPTFAAVTSHNNFPTGAGIASSASAFAALTVAAAAAQLPLPADSELKATEPIAPVEKPANPLPVITVTPAPASAHDAHSPQTGGRVYPVESAAPELPAPEPTAPPAPLHDQPAHMPEFDSYMDKRAVLTTAAPTTAEPVVADSKVTEPVAPIALDTASLTAQSDRNTPQGLQACIDSARAANDQAALADCALRLGDLYMNAQDMTDAITNYQIAIAALRTGSDQYLTALALERLGHAQLIDGEPGTAAQSLEAAVELLGSDTRLADRARVLTALGSTYDLLQDWSAAQRSHENGAEASQRVNDHAQEAIHLGGLARAHQAQGHPADAINSYRKGLHVAYRLNDSDLIAGYGTQLGGLLLTDGKTLNQAVSLLSESISRHPENVDTLRLLKRGQRWIDQARSNQVVLPDALDNPQYARLAYPAEIG